MVPLRQNSPVTSVRLLPRFDRPGPSTSTAGRPRALGSQRRDALGDLLRHQTAPAVGTAGCDKCGRKFLSRRRHREHYALAHILELD